MEVVETIEAMRQARRAFGRVGLVPTMGFLHTGHLALIRRAHAECEQVVVSVFVNPTQFAPHEDFESYPRNMDRDLALLAGEGVDLVFTPASSTMYPAGYNTFVDVYGVTDTLEGAARPGFFRGVATVVCKLFTIVQPDRAYFGQKDAQQTVVVRKMVRDLNLPLEVVVCPTVREADGLAMSSRNAYLNAAERQAAPVLYRALTAAQQQYLAGERDAGTLRDTMQQVLAHEPLAQPEYVSVADLHTLQELAWVGDSGALLSMAVRVGPTRLIDNIMLDASRAGQVRVPHPGRQAPW
ncbi:MAG: pantoate--beta-alanine ligase [Chloroflexaceae bacterium]|nr:pantoate--beta-alanine ligase [Chloroflexaceae bacterium]